MRIIHFSSLFSSPLLAKKCKVEQPASGPAASNPFPGYFTYVFVKKWRVPAKVEKCQKSVKKVSSFLAKELIVEQAPSGGPARKLTARTPAPLPGQGSSPTLRGLPAKRDKKVTKVTEKTKKSDGKVTKWRYDRPGVGSRPFKGRRNITNLATFRHFLSLLAR